MLLSHGMPLVIVLSAAGLASADITFTPASVTIDFSRTWRDESTAIIASDSATFGPLMFEANLPGFNPSFPGLTVTPEFTLPGDSLPAPAQPAWPSHASGHAEVRLLGNSQSIHSGAGTAIFAHAGLPVIGQAVLRADVLHTIDFQLSTDTPWQASLQTVLTIPIFPKFDIIREPDGTPISVASARLPETDPDMFMTVGGILPAGSYRAITSLSVEINRPGTGSAGTFFGGVNFVVPSPACMPAFLGVTLVLARRRRG